MRISIISPSFNQRKYLELMTNSVFIQTHEDYEHLIFDPGSTDGSIEVLSAYSLKNPRAQLICEPDNGQIDAINKGLANSSGEILTWLNSDDYYYDAHVLDIVSNYFNCHPNVDIAYGRGLRVGENGETIRQAYVHPQGTVFSESLEHSIGLLQPSLFFRRRIYEKLGGLDETWPLQLDYELWIRFALAGCQFGYINAFLSKATVHREAKSTKARQKQLNECLELVANRFCFVAADWINRFAEFFLTQRDGKVEGRITLNADENLKRELISKALYRHYNAPTFASGLLSKSTPARQRTIEAMQALDVYPPAPRRTIVTSFDSHYFNQGLNLIASLHRTSLESFDRIIVFPLNLTEFERVRLSWLEKVQIVDYPADIIKQTFPDFLEPKARAYKAYAMRPDFKLTEPGELLLWMDAGLSALQDINAVFTLIDKHDFFIADHDDSRFWPFFNISFIHDECRKILNPSNSELMAKQLCSALVGYKIGGCYQKIFDHAWEIGKLRNAVIWPKILDKSKKKTSTLNKEDQSLRDDLVKGDVDPESITQIKLLSLFDHLGHRTQSVLSVLAHRYDAPVFSGSIFRQGNDSSSKAAHKNWQKSAKESDKLASRENLQNVSDRTIIYHHRGIFHLLDGLRFRNSSQDIFLLGNGPSLRGFDFNRLKNYDTLGMNAAYRFWHSSGFYPTYYACFDTVVQESHQEEILRLIHERKTNGIRRFFLRETILEQYPELSSDPCVYFLEELQRSVYWFQLDKITTGSFSVLVGLFLGYRRLYLLGIDLNYVEKLPEAHVDGRTLEIVETPGSNPNYFFDGYQVKGDRYNPPNRHPDMHLRSWRQIKEFLDTFPAQVINLNPNSAVRDFPFDSFDCIDKELSSHYRAATAHAEAVLQWSAERQYWRNDLLTRLQQINSIVLGPYDRSISAHWEETKVVETLFTSLIRGTMIDVGAHDGSALVPFLDHAWRIYAFEPDNQNRTKLLERLAKHKNKDLVSLDTRCVSNQNQKGCCFFTSEESTGISGLSAFHKTHHESQKVDVITLTEFFQNKPMPAVDFLKIDTEGHDLFVLQGFPWERTKPAVIECEFEDLKTVPLGYTFHDLAKFLVDKGYTVYVSEWHPIIRYGIRHDWKQLLRYPCELSDPKSWGNLLAFRDPIDEQALIAAVKKVLKVNAEGTAQKPAALPKMAAPAQPAAALPVSSANHGFRFEPGAHFTSIAPSQWRFIDTEARQKLWVAAMDSPLSTVGRSFVGTLRVMADRSMTVNVSLGRHGKSEYEGTSKRIALAPDVPQIVKLSKLFKQAHAALKLQVEVLALPGGGSAVLTIDGLGICESLSSIRERVGVGSFDLRTANRLFREGDYSAALGIYLWLGQQRPLTMYGDNAVRAARRAGMPWVKAAGDVAWVVG